MIGSSADVTLEPVISKRFEPTRFEWLSTASSVRHRRDRSQPAAARPASPLFLHRVSEVLATARDPPAFADATLGTILEVTGGDRAAFVLRR